MMRLLRSPATAVAAILGCVAAAGLILAHGYAKGSGNAAVDASSAFDPGRLRDFHATNSGRHVRFVVLGDTQGRDSGVAGDVLRKIAAQVAAIEPPPAFVLHVGDVVSAAGAPVPGRSGQNEYDLFWEAADPIAAIPLVAAEGNHDAVPNPLSPLSESKRHVNFLREIGNARVLRIGPFGDVRMCPGEEGLTFAFTVGPARFVVLTAYVHKDKPPFMPSEAALAFLKKELSAAHQDGRLLFVAIHPPAYPVATHFRTSLDAVPAVRDYFWRLMEGRDLSDERMSTYGAAGLFCGHEHNCHRALIGEVRQFGVTSGPVRHRLPRRAVEAYFNRPAFLVVDVVDREVRVRTISPQGEVLDVFVYVSGTARTTKTDSTKRKQESAGSPEWQRQQSPPAKLPPAPAYRRGQWSLTRLPDTLGRSRRRAAGGSFRYRDCRTRLASRGSGHWDRRHAGRLPDTLGRSRERKLPPAARR